MERHRAKPQRGYVVHFLTVTLSHIILLLKPTVTEGEPTVTKWWSNCDIFSSNFSYSILLKNATDRILLAERNHYRGHTHADSESELDSLDA